MQAIMARLLTWIKSNPFTNKFYGVKSRNEGAFLAFNADWFEKYQTLLLIALNMPVLSILVRYMMRLHESNVFMPICKITPSNVTFWKGKTKRTLIAYTHVKFSKRVYFSLRWFWWSLHYIDEFLSYFKIPEQVSFGFSTLTAYSQSGTNSPCDGYVYKGQTGKTFGQLRDNLTSGGLTGFPNTSNSYAYLDTSFSSSPYYTYLGRMFWGFDTSSLGASANINSITLSVVAENKFNQLGTTDLIISGAYPASSSTLVGDDYTKIYRDIMATVAYADFASINTRMNIALTDTSNYINKTGITHLSGQTSWDNSNNYTGTWASSSKSGFTTYTADVSGTSYDPYITIDYSTSSIKSHIGTAAADCKKHIGTASADIKKHIETT